MEARPRGDRRRRMGFGVGRPWRILQGEGERCEVWERDEKEREREGHGAAKGGPAWGRGHRRMVRRAPANEVDEATEHRRSGSSPGEEDGALGAEVLGPRSSPRRAGCGLGRPCGVEEAERRRGGLLVDAGGGAGGGYPLGRRQVAVEGRLGAESEEGEG